MKCKSCGIELPDQAKFCFSCGKKVEKETLCVKCGTKLQEGAKFCMECGEQVIVGAQKEYPLETVNIKMEKIFEKAKAEKCKICEPARGILGIELCGYWHLLDLREQAIIEAIEQKMTQHQITLKGLLSSYTFYMETEIKQLEGRAAYAHLFNPIWIGEDMDCNAIFYLDTNFTFYKCSFEVCDDSNPFVTAKANANQWDDVEFLKGKANAIRIFAREHSSEMSDQFYLFDETGKVLWKPDRPVTFSGYDREIGYEFLCSPGYMPDSDTAMLVDFYTGQVLLKGYYGIINYRERGSNRLVLDGLNRIGYEKYKHDLFYYDNGTISKFTEQEYQIAGGDKSDFYLTRKYVPGHGERTEFKKYGRWDLDENAKNRDSFAKEFKAKNILYKKAI